MTKQVINIGQSANDKSGDPLRTAFNKINQNFTELYSLPTLPSQTGHTNQYLKTDGAGNLSWSSVSSGGSTGDITFSGVMIQGAGTASGDGNNYSTIELVPDSTLYDVSPSGAYGDYGQYLIIDPTSPGHIHIRAGGPIDEAAAQLILGGEKANVTVRDQNNSYIENHHVIINTEANDSTHYSWTFGNDGTFNLPESVSPGNAIIQTTSAINFQVNSNSHVWTFGTDGVLTLPVGGDIKNSGGDSVLLPAVDTVATTAMTSLTTSQEIILCDPTTAGGNVDLYLPDSPPEGKIYTVKNISPGTTYIGTTGPSVYMETEFGSVLTGSYATIHADGGTITWVFSNNTYRIINKFGL